MSTLRTIKFLAIASAAAVTATRSSQQQQFLGPSNETEWHKYIKGPPSRVIAPPVIVANYTAGNVSNPEALLSKGGNLVLTRLNESDPVPTVVLDFGMPIAGQLRIDFAGSYSPNGSRPGLRLAFSETKAWLSDRSDFTRSDNAEHETGGTDQIAVKEQPYTWVDQLGCEDEQEKKVCSDGTHGFRYLKITLDAVDKDQPYTSPLGIVSISFVSLFFTPFLGTPDTYTSHFECSDPELTQSWYNAVYTNELCIEVFHANDTEPRNAFSPTLDGKLVLYDGPKRDRDPYIGDIAISGLTLYLSHAGAAQAVANVIADLAEHQRSDGWIPPSSINGYALPLFDYPLWWIVCLYDYVMYTGNLTFADTYYSVMAKALDGYYVSNTNPSTGLLQRPGGGGDFAFLPRNGGAPTYYNALYSFALQHAARLANFLERGQDANRWYGVAGKLRIALLERNWDHGAGVFWDGGSCDGYDMCPVHSQDGNSLAILAGITDNAVLSPSGEAAESVLAYLDTHMKYWYGNALMDNDLLGPGLSTRVYAFTSYFEIAARLSSLNAKTAASGLDQIRRMYGWMANHDPGVTQWEGIGQDGRPYSDGFTSMAHGWSTGIVPLLVQNVLGLRPTSPGFKTWTMKPLTFAGGLTWARGTVQTPHGNIVVGWEKDNAGNTTTVMVDSPTDTSGTLQLPLVNVEDTITVDGVVVFSKTQGGAVIAGVQVGDGYVSIPLKGGGSRRLSTWQEG